MSATSGSVSSYPTKYNGPTQSDVEQLQRTINGSECYNRSHVSRNFAFVGITITILLSVFSVGGGIMVFHLKGTSLAPSGVEGLAIIKDDSTLQRDVLTLVMNATVTLSTEGIGYIHSIALRSALACENRLCFSTNLRLATAARGLSNLNGTAVNIIMMFLLITSYNASVLSIMPIYDANAASQSSESGAQLCLLGIPLIVLGVSLLCQALVAIVAVHWTTVITWSTSPFDVAAALVHHAHVRHEPSRCMRGVYELMKGHKSGPAAPKSRQASAFRAHPSIRKVLLLLWCLVVWYALWCVGGLLVCTAHMHEPLSTTEKLLYLIKSWTFFPDLDDHILSLSFSIPIPGGIRWYYWILCFVTVAAIQGPLTLALHCSELIASVVRDEHVWRLASKPKGASPWTALGSIFYRWNFLLLVVKPALHWMLGLVVSLDGTSGGVTLDSIAVTLYPLQLLNITLALLGFTIIFTIVSISSPHGPQPAAYGHIQTLANLIDEWSPSMWWGDKTTDDEADIRHAGTSDHALYPVKMDSVYAGRGSRSH